MDGERKGGGGGAEVQCVVGDLGARCDGAVVDTWVVVNAVFQHREGSSGWRENLNLFALREK